LSLEFGAYLTAIGIAAVFSTLALVALASAALKRMFKEAPAEETLKQAAVATTTEAVEQPRSETLRIVVDGKEHNVAVRDMGGGEADDKRLTLPSVSGEEMKILVDGEEHTVKIQGGTARAVPATRRTSATVEPVPSCEDVVKTPMRATVLKILVKPGDTVKKGMPMFILEAMKMENTIESRASGIVKSVEVTEGQTVNADDVLATIG